MITKETIDKIFSAIRVEEIVGEYVQLKRAGSNYKGLSPFVDEKTPSFIVSPSKQIWKDFSSGKGGTAISFLMEIEGFSYPEALRYAAKKYGIEIEELKKDLTEEEKKVQTDKDLLYKIHEVANDFFQNQLYETEEGRNIGLSYFKERELKLETIKKFQLGYSPELKNAFTQYAVSKGYSKEILEKSGLSIFSEKSTEGIDRFRERVIFPIHGFSGRVLGFGGRILKSNTKTAKYLNSPETEIYHKSNVLYGLFQSKQAVSRENMCLLVEGYMDVVALHQSGIENVVASSGTSLTTEQIKLIKRLTENVTILFDGDAAGIKASFRSIDMLLAESMNIRILLFPEGHDPDSFARENSMEFVKNFIKENSKDFIDFKAEILLKETENDPIKKAEAIRDIVKSVAHVDNGLKQEIYLKQIATQFGLTERNLFDELQVQKQILKGQSQSQPKSKLEIVLKTEEKPFVDSDKTTGLLVLEEKLVELMLKYGDRILTRRDSENNSYQTTVIEEIIHHFQEDDCEILTETNRKIIDEVRQGLEQNEIRSGNFFFGLMDEDISGKIADALVENYETSDWKKFNIYFRTEDEVLDKVVRDVILRHKREYVLKLIEDLKKSLDETEEKAEIYEQIVRLNQLKSKIDQKLFRIL
jgi:DNA primase